MIRVEMLCRVIQVENSKPCCLSAITAEFQPLTDSSDIARAFLYKLEAGEIDTKALVQKFRNKNIAL